MIGFNDKELRKEKDVEIATLRHEKDAEIATLMERLTLLEANLK